MTQLTAEDKQSAIARLIADWTRVLADMSLSVQLHRDILRSPAEQVAALEKQAETAARAIAWLESERGKV